MDKEKLLKTVQSWNINKEPEYRGFRCANCQRYIRKAWHIWFDYKGFKCEIHLCKKCFKEYKNEATLNFKKA
jgi:hypothetical protein